MDIYIYNLNREAFSFHYGHINPEDEERIQCYIEDFYFYAKISKNETFGGLLKKLDGLFLYFPSKENILEYCQAELSKFCLDKNFMYSDDEYSDDEYPDGVFYNVEKDLKSNKEIMELYINDAGNLHFRKFV